MKKLGDRIMGELVLAAKEAASSAYAPYSKFRVGAAVLCGDQMYTGCNVENASYGLTLCAERNAISTAIAQGHRSVDALAVACIDAPVNADICDLSPCGACRQWIAELGPDAVIIICGKENHTLFSITDLLPHSFRVR